MFSALKKRDEKEEKEEKEEEEEKREGDGEGIDVGVSV